MPLPRKYVPKSLTPRDRRKQIASIRSGTRRPKVGSFKSRRSGWAVRFEKKYGVKITDTKFIDRHILRRPGIDGVLDKGRGAYFSGGSRPNQTPDSWAYARLASVILGGPARKVDNALWSKFRVTGRDEYDQIVAGFKPSLTPRQMFRMGSFGGTYWRPIRSGVVGKRLSGQHRKYPKSWWVGIPDRKMTLAFDRYDKSVNRFKVKVGTTLQFWESKKWITEYHPYGWVQWYCDWCVGKRCVDDVRQIRRWAALAGPKGRFRNMLINMVRQGRESPKIRQTLQHWACRVTRADVRK